MTLPSSYLYPNYEPDRHTQWQWAYDGWLFELNDCMAHASSLALEIMHYKKTGKVKHFSWQWVYGNRRYSSYYDEGLNAVDTLNMLVNDGCPFYYDLPQNFFYNKQVYYDMSTIDTSPLISAKDAVDSVYSSLITEARKNKITSWIDIKDSGTDVIKQAIIDVGCLIIHVPSGDSLWDAEDDGIVVGDGGGSGLSHTMVIRGWDTINSVESWICQNSWCDSVGTPLGDNGLYYIPFNHHTIYNIWKLNYNTTNYTYPTPCTFRDSIASESAVSIYAQDWNKLLDLIYEEYYRFKHEPYTYEVRHPTYVNTDDYITASTYNFATSVYERLVGNYSVFSSKYTDYYIYATDFTNLMNLINNRLGV